MHHAAVLRASNGTRWDEIASGLHPGAYVAALDASWLPPLEARRAGLSLRDTLLVVAPEGNYQGYLFRKPLAAATILGQVAATGTGALNIDGCRVEGQVDTPGSVRPIRGFFREGLSSDLAPPPAPHSGGRWPSNLLLVHQPGCRRDGTRQVRGSFSLGGGSRPGGFGNVGAASGGSVPVSHGYADENGLETVPAWVCEDGCPAGAMDDQSGPSSSPSGIHESVRSDTSGWKHRGGIFLPGRVHVWEGHGDEGGASRYYAQFANLDEVLGWFQRLILPPGGQLLV